MAYVLELCLEGALLRLRAEGGPVDLHFITGGGDHLVTDFITDWLEGWGCVRERDIL